MDSLRLDLRYALRGLLNRPGFAALAVLTLAVGIGVNAVAFAGLNAFLFKPLAFEDAEELGWIVTTSPGNPHSEASLPDYEELAQGASAFDAIIAEGRMPLSLRSADRSEQAWGLLVSTNYLPALRVRPRIGRLFGKADLLAAEVPVLVSERFWNGRLGGGESVAGRSVTLNGRSFAVLGVVPEGFQGPGGFYEPDVWLPLDRIEVMGLAAALRTRERNWLGLAGRLRPGATLAQAQAELQAFAARRGEMYPGTNEQRSLTFVPVTDGNPEVHRVARLAWIPLAVVGVVLLLACFNVAGLLLARTAERQRELGVRTALGASRARVLRQLVTEGALLASLSGAAALVAAFWTADLLSAFSLPSPIPQRLHIRFDWRFAAFMGALVAAAACLPAIVPALHATRREALRAIRTEPAFGGRPSRMRNGFVIAQIAGSTLFLAAALLSVRSFWNAAAFDPGFDIERTLVLELTPSNYGYTAARSQAFFDRLVERLSAVPGVSRAALADRVPFYVGYAKLSPVAIAGEDCSLRKCRDVTEYAVGPGHFAALGISLEAGREFTGEESRSDGMAVISATMAARFWPGESALGQSFRYGRDRRVMEVIGVAADVTHHRMGEDPAAYVYRPLQAGDFADRVTVIVRASGDPRLLIGAVQEQVRAIDADLPATAVKTMNERMTLPLWPSRTAARFFLVCGTLALVLSTVGLFGVTYFTVSQRTREFGVRIAIGATPRNLLSLVLREGLLLTVPGIALGVAGALAITRVAASALFGVSAADPLSYGATAAVQAAVAVAACALPAWRATRADPMIALRAE